MRIVFLFFCFLYSLQIFSQEGYLYLKHFKVPLPEQQYFFNDLTTDHQNRLLVAHRSGILQFDGKIWDKIGTESTPYQFIAIEDTTYVLTKNGISLLKQDVFSQNVIESVFKNPNLVRGKDLIKYGEDFYYLIENKILRLKNNTFKVDTTYKSNLGYEDIFTFQNRLFAFEGNYLLEFIDGTWVDLNMYASENSDFVFSCQTDSRVFFAYDNGDFFIFDGEQLEKYSQALNDYLKENYPVSGKVIGDKLLVATVSGGAVVVNILDGAIDYTIQYHNGLPADEVKATTIDQQGGIWLAHAGGLTRAIPDLPLKEYHHYPGISGLPQTIIKRNDTLFIGTSEGLFHLDGIKDYEQLQQVLRKKIRVRNPLYSSGEEDTESSSIFEDLFNLSDNEEDSEKEDFINQRLKYFKEVYRSQGIRFKNLREKLVEKEAFLRDSLRKTQLGQQAKAAKKYTYKTVRKVVNVSKLKSIKYQYKKVEGLNKKVIKIIDTPTGFYALASDGLYRIESSKAERIWTQLFLNDMQYDAVHSVLWLYGSEGLYKCSLNKKETNLAIQKMEIDMPVSDLCLYQDRLAVSNNNELRIYEIKNKFELKLLKKMAFDNPYAQKVLLFHQQKALNILKSDGLYQLDVNTDSLTLTKRYQKDQISYFKDNRGSVWLSSAGDWQILNRTKESEELTWLKILPQMSEIYVASDQFIYFISANMIIRLDTERDYQIAGTSSFIKGAYQASSELFEAEDIKLTHDKNSLMVSLSTPEYLFPEGVKYQYYVKGLMDDWSSWSGASEIPFPFIPTGDYTLEVRTRSGLYSETKSLEFDFEVLPPYWQTWWFYMLEIAFFSILILISQKLNQSSRNSYLTNTITFLTLILFIEFIATVLENNLEGYVDESPVYGFILNVVLALSISPLEKGMNKLLLIMNSKRVKHLVAQMHNKKQLKEKKHGESKN